MYVCKIAILVNEIYQYIVATMSVVSMYIMH